MEAFAAAGERLARSESLDEALGEIARAAAKAVGADLVVVRVLDHEGFLRVRALTAASRALAAELEGSRYPLADPDSAGDGVRAALSAAVDRTAERVGAGAGLVVPVLVAARPAGSVELYRSRRPLAAAEERVARLAAAQAALAVRAHGGVNGANGSQPPGLASLDLAGDALAAGLEQASTADQIARVASKRRARSARRYGTSTRAPRSGAWPLPRRGRTGGRGRGSGRSAGVVVAGTIATIPLGRPPFALLQLRFPPDAVPTGDELDRLGQASAYARRTRCGSASASAVLRATSSARRRFSASSVRRSHGCR